MVSNTRILWIETEYTTRALKRKEEICEEDQTKDDSFVNIVDPSTVRHHHRDMVLHDVWQTASCVAQRIGQYGQNV